MCAGSGRKKMFSYAEDCNWRFEALCVGKLEKIAYRHQNKTESN